MVAYVLVGTGELARLFGCFADYWCPRLAEAFTLCFCLDEEEVRLRFI